jgi:S1-C subfamily serine protease
MKVKIHKPFIWLMSLALLITTGCGGSSQTPTITPTPTSTTVVRPILTKAPTYTPSPTPALPVSYLVDVENAVIRVEGQGKFFSPKFAQTTADPGRGSGFIIDPSGLAVTTSQAVAGTDSVRVWVGREQKTPLDARVLATNECANLAIIDIDGDGFDFLDWFKEPVLSGQKVYVGGFPLGKSLYVLKSGDVKNPARKGLAPSWGSVESWIEFDISPEKGLAGGPLLSPEGKVIGVNLSGDPGQAQSLGVSQAIALPILNQLQQANYPGSLGINGQAISSEDGSLSGIWVFTVPDGSPASDLGLEGGDLITQIGGQVLDGADSFARYCQVLSENSPDAPVSVQVYREASSSVLEGQLNGKPLVIVSSGIPALVSSGTPGTPVAPNLSAKKPGDVFLQDDFSTDTRTWEQSWMGFLTQGIEDQVTYSIQNNKLVVEINSPLTYAYYLFKSLNVSDVRIDTKVDNLGHNNNNVSLVCRGSIEKGWYEFNVASNGLYWVKRYDPKVRGYIDIGKGGSTLIKTGQATNEISAICQGNQLSLMINGALVRTFRDNVLVTGQVGLSVASYFVLPVKVAFDYFKVSVPPSVTPTP